MEHKKRNKTKIIKLVVSLVIIATLISVFSLSFRRNVVPIVIESSISHIRAIGTNAVNLAATTVLNGGIEYGDLFTVEREDGKIKMISANSPQINSIAREIANLAQANLDSLGVQNISIALGTFTGLALLTGVGPAIELNIIPIGTANCDFVSQFIGAGINQTLHKIYIDVYADINIITPMDDTNILVKAEVLICENLIIGEIPEFYLNPSNSGSILDLLP